MQKRLGINIKLSIEPKIIDNSARILNIFQHIDQLGNYSNHTWFDNLQHRDLRNFVYYLYDIWIYRAQLTNEAKLEICPGTGNPFIGFEMHNIRNHDFVRLKNIALIIIERMIYNGINRSSQYIASNYILGALTLVCPEAASAMPWLYESFIIN